MLPCSSLVLLVAGGETAVGLGDEGSGGVAWQVVQAGDGAGECLASGTHLDTYVPCLPLVEVDHQVAEDDDVLAAVGCGPLAEAVDAMVAVLGAGIAVGWAGHLV